MSPEDEELLDVISWWQQSQWGHRHCFHQTLHTPFSRLVLWFTVLFPVSVICIVIRIAWSCVSLFHDCIAHRL
jgi:hypothetical protein